MSGRKKRSRDDANDDTEQTDANDDTEQTDAKRLKEANDGETKQTDAVNRKRPAETKDQESNKKRMVRPTSREIKRMKRLEAALRRQQQRNKVETLGELLSKIKIKNFYTESQLRF